MSLHLHSFPDVLHRAVLVQMFLQPEQSPCAALISLEDNRERTSACGLVQHKGTVGWHNTRSRSSPCTPPQSTAPSAPCFQPGGVSQCHRRAPLPHLHPGSPHCCAHVSELRAQSLPSAKKQFSVTLVFLIDTPQAPVPAQSLLVRSGISMVLSCHRHVPARCHTPLLCRDTGRLPL